jgi:hypothetical protein
MSMAIWATLTAILALVSLVGANTDSSDGKEEQITFLQVESKFLLFFFCFYSSFSKLRLHFPSR